MALYKVGGFTNGQIEAFAKRKLKWFNTALGKIKSALTGTYRHVSSKLVARYLAEFQYRFNRYYDLAGMLSRLSYVSLHTPPMLYKLLILAEAFG